MMRLIKDDQQNTDGDDDRGNGTYLEAKTRMVVFERLMNRIAQESLETWRIICHCTIVQ